VWDVSHYLERLGDGEASAVLALLWALALHFQFRALLPPGASVPPPQGRSAADGHGMVRRALQDKIARFLAAAPHDEGDSGRPGSAVVTNFQQDFSDGTLFSALIHRYATTSLARAPSEQPRCFTDTSTTRQLTCIGGGCNNVHIACKCDNRQCPEVLDVKGLDPKDKRGNLKRALRLLHRKWGVPKLLGTPRPPPTIVMANVRTIY
jgi:hypothetical protein